MSQPIRVLELRSIRGTGGGPEKTILFGTRHADPHRFAVTACYIRDLRDAEFQLDRRAKELGIDYVEIPERHSFDPGVWPKLRQLVRSRQFDIVHSHEYKTNLLAWLLARSEGTVPLSTVHGWFGRGTWRERVYYAADKRLLAKFPRLVAVSNELKTELVRAGVSAASVIVVPNGIDDRAFKRQPGEREAMRQALGLGPTDIAVGAVGRLERQKRFDLLMDAIQALHHQRPAIKLFIVGDGGLMSELAAYKSARGLDGSCVLLGYRSDVPLLHHAFDLFVQASDCEGSPNVVLEAMALETPVVVTDVGGTTDLVTNGVHGLVVPPGDSVALRNAIEKALSDPAATLARATAGRRRVVEELSFEARMSRVEAVYEELVSHREPSLPSTRAVCPARAVRSSSVGRDDQR